MTKSKLVIKFDEDDYLGKDIPKALVFDNEKDAESFLEGKGFSNIEFDLTWNYFSFKKDGYLRCKGEAFWATYL